MIQIRLIEARSRPRPSGQSGAWGISYQLYNPAAECGEPACVYEREQWAARKPSSRKLGLVSVDHRLNCGCPDAGIRNSRSLHQALKALTGQGTRKSGMMTSAPRGAVNKPSEEECLMHLYNYAGNGLESRPYRREEWRNAQESQLAPRRT
jgi:hypothetical protein